MFMYWLFLLRFSRSSFHAPVFTHRDFTWNWSLVQTTGQINRSEIATSISTGNLKSPDKITAKISTKIFSVYTSRLVWGAVQYVMWFMYLFFLIQNSSSLHFVSKIKKFIIQANFALVIDFILVTVTVKNKTKTNQQNSILDAFTNILGGGSTLKIKQLVLIAPFLLF